MRKTKPLIFLLALTFLFLFSGSVFAYEFDRFKELVGGSKMTYVYTSNEGIETRT